MHACMHTFTNPVASGAGSLLSIEVRNKDYVRFQDKLRSFGAKHLCVSSKTVFKGIILL